MSIFIALGDLCVNPHVPPLRNGLRREKSVTAPFKLAVRCRVVRGGWKFFIDGVGYTNNCTVSKGYHNHFFVPYPEASTESNALTSEEKSEIRDMLVTHTQPNKIRYALNKQFNSHHNINQIYNESYKVRKEKLGGMSSTDWTLRAATRHGYFVQSTEDDNKNLANLFLCHTESAQMLEAWYYVILIDSTYNTNKYWLSVIQLIGVTPVQKNFTIGFALVENEKAETYIWLLNQLRSLLGERQPTTFVTDKERGLAVALRTVFPEMPHLLCVWHIKRNITAKIKFITMSEESYEAFVHGRWNRVLNALSHEEFYEE